MEEEFVCEIAQVRGDSHWVGRGDSHWVGRHWDLVHLPSAALLFDFTSL